MKKHPLKLNRWVAVGALSVFGCNALFSIANKMTTAANAIVLQFTAPIFVMLFSVLLFGKKLSRLDVITSVCVFLGILCFFLEGLGGGSIWGDLIALLSGVTYAGVFLMKELPDSDALSSVFWGDVLSAVTGLPFLFRETEFTASVLGSLLILGVFQVAVAYIMLTEGLKTTPPVTASLVSGIEPVLNPVLVAVFYREYIGPMSFAGAVMVVGSVIIYNVLLERQKRPAP